jgi:vacuolar-type H+-ATPase subunit H
MDKDVLSEVIEVEKDIQKSLELEKGKSCLWLEQARKDLKEEYAREEQNIAASLKRFTEEAKRDSEIKAAEILKETMRINSRFAAVNDRTLSGIVENHIHKILPG